MITYSLALCLFRIYSVCRPIITLKVFRPGIKDAANADASCNIAPVTRV